MAIKKDTAADTAKERRAAERRVPPKAAPKESPKTAKPAVFNSNARAEISPDELRKLVSEAAYYRAKQRGFAPGHEEEDWIQAEAEVIRRLNSPSRAA
jgi:Protein of unknown function (DUF2934)